MEGLDGQTVGQRLCEQLCRSRGKGGSEERGTGRREGGVLVWDELGKELPGLGRRDGGLRDDRDRGGGRALGETRDPAVPGQACPSGESRREVVGVPLELQPDREQLLGVGLTSDDDGGPNEVMLLSIRLAGSWRARHEI